MCLHINCIRKMIAQFLLFKTIFRQRNCFLSPLATDGKDQQWIETWPESWPNFFHVLMLCLQKNNNQKYEG